MAAKTRSKTSNHYEGLFLFGANYTSQTDAALDIVKGFVEKHGGKLEVLKKWDDRKLVYPVNKQTRGLYIITFFSAPSEAIAQIEREVNFSDDVLRVLITDASHLSAAEIENHVPQKPEPKKSDDDDDDMPRRAPRDDDGGDDDGGEEVASEAEIKGGAAEPA